MKSLIDHAESLVAEQYSFEGSPAARAAHAVLLLRRAAAAMADRLSDLEEDERLDKAIALARTAERLRRA